MLTYFTKDKSWLLEIFFSGKAIVDESNNNINEISYATPLVNSFPIIHFSRHPRSKSFSKNVKKNRNLHRQKTLSNYYKYSIRIQYM